MYIYIFLIDITYEFVRISRGNDIFGVFLSQESLSFVFYTSFDNYYPRKLYIRVDFMRFKTIYKLLYD